MLNDISVVVCTYNRAEMLRDTLESWLSLQNTRFKVELIIVDNNSTDHTAQVVESFRSVYPSRLHYICEANVGLSYARNRGIKEASGKIVAFVDDDVFFDKDWLKEVLKAFNSHKEISCVGGNTIPKFDAAKPSWITGNVLKLYGSTGSGDHDKFMIFPEYPVGLNMAFRNEVFTQVGEFNTKLGRIKNSLLSNEEREIFYRISKADLKVLYASKAILYHRIPRDRMSKSWVFKRFYWQGISDVVFWQIIKPRSKLILFLKTIKTIWILAKKITFSLESFSFKDKLAIYHLLGTAKQNLAEILTISK